MLELTQKVIDEVNKEVVAMREKGLSYGLQVYDNIEDKVLKNIIDDMGGFVESHLDYAARHFAGSFNRHSAMAGYLARETETEYLGIFYSLLNNQLKLDRLTPPYPLIPEMNYSVVKEIEPTDDVQYILSQLDEAAQIMLEQTSENLEEMAENTQNIIINLRDNGVEKYTNQLRQFPFLFTTREPLVGRIAIHLQGSLVNLYQDIENSLYTDKLPKFTSQSHSLQDFGVYQ
ncbi:MAG: hypothetical protein ACOCZ6_03100 [Nanoarchaeota archaeon]